MKSAAIQYKYSQSRKRSTFSFSFVFFLSFLLVFTVSQKASKHHIRVCRKTRQQHITFTFTYPLTARVVAAPQMTVSLKTIEYYIASSLKSRQHHITVSPKTREHHLASVSLNTREHQIASSHEIRQPHITVSDKTRECHITVNHKTEKHHIKFICKTLTAIIFGLVSEVG